MPPRKQQFSTRILQWFEQHGRKKLPWQVKRKAYQTWVSEVMLQQTQVSTVAPYYLRFMQSFPTVADLANTDEDTLLHHWTGLGYYARARNLHKTAQIIHRDFADVFPDSVEALSALPGIGRSTAGAIVSLAYNKPAAILDGNVKRVLCRYHGIEGWPDQSSIQKQLWALAEQHVPDQQCAEYTQAIMDMGATLCTRSKPDCPACPLKRTCLAFELGRTEELPYSKPRKKLPIKNTRMLILLSADKQQVLLEKRPPQGIWGGLWSFPEFALETEVGELVGRHAPGIKHSQESWEQIRHTFSHFHLDIQPVTATLAKEPGQVMENERWRWYDLRQPEQLGLAKPVEKILAQLGKAS